MAGVINISGLSTENIKLVQELVEFLREKARKTGLKETKDREAETEKIKFSTWQSNVKGKLTRKEIYDYL